jgi:putative ABC transport system ATP-binding protein
MPETETETDTPARGAADALSVSGLVKAYRLGDERIPVLQGLSLNVGSGEFVAIMGPSGSGKTTLLNCIAGIDTPDEGGVALAGTPVDYRSHGRARCSGAATSASSSSSSTSSRR